MNACPPLRVLVVEDEALLAWDLEALIEDSGHVVAGEARCLDSAVALADATDPQLAFVDVHLARNTSGLDVSTMIQQRWPDAMIVFVTANPQTIPNDLGGAHGVISKPFTRKGMSAALEFLTEGLCDPPPRVQQPECLMTSPAAARRLFHHGRVGSRLL